jgi:hypothetical protein
MAASKSNATRKEIAGFLRDFKEAMITGPGLIVKVNQKNLQAVADLGMTARERDDSLLALTVEDYCSGPHPDRDFPGDVWIFGTAVEDREVYIKLKLVTRRGIDFPHCLSFHTAEFQLYYPYKRSLDD